MSEMFGDRHLVGWPIIESPEEIERRERRKVKPKSKLPSPDIPGVIVLAYKPSDDTISQRKDWEASHGNIGDYKSRFLPYSGWTCPACQVNLNNKPRPECTSEKHQQHYAKRHPRYQIPDASISKQTRSTNT